MIFFSGKKQASYFYILLKMYEFVFALMLTSRRISILRFKEKKGFNSEI